MKKTKIIGFTLLVLLLVSATTLLQQKDRKEMIIGDWKSEGCSTCIWSFHDDGKIKRYYKGSLYKTYTYTIQSEKSVNGKLTHYTLRLVNVGDSKDIYDYLIIGLSQDSMRLDYTGDLNAKLSVFTKQ